MPALSYSKQNIQQYDFKNKILQRIKKHTIRRYRKRPFKLNDILYQYENWRTPQVNKFYEDNCLYVADIEIKRITEGSYDDILIYINNLILRFDQRKLLAKNDGFDSYEDFKKYFIKSGLPFYGQIIGWTKDIDYEY